MYVCICVGVTENELVTAIASGCNTMEQLMYETGVSLGCGTCSSDVESILTRVNQTSIKLDIPVIKPL